MIVEENSRCLGNSKDAMFVFGLSLGKKMGMLSELAYFVRTGT